MKFRLLTKLLVLSSILLISLDVLASRVYPVLGIHPTSIRYWEDSIYANAVKQGVWLEYEGREWGDFIREHDNPQFDIYGNPLYLNEGKKLKIVPAAFSGEFKPVGVITLQWEGEADIRVNRADRLFLSEKSNGPNTGALVDGVRAYRLTGNEQFWIEVNEINPENPPKNIRAYLPDPSDPVNSSLTGNDIWHPDFLDRLSDVADSVIRTMGLTDTNGSPEQDWEDRRLPDHIFSVGVLNPRSPVPNELVNGKEVRGDRRTGVPWEHLVHMANASGHDLWINIPHLATEDYIRNLALLIKYGSDGVHPYQTVVEKPVWGGLSPELRVWVEYSNEIWSRGNSFPQGDYAEIEGRKSGLDKWQFNARKFVDSWKIFDDIFKDTDRVVNVAALHTGSRWYVENFAKEMAHYIRLQGLSLTPDVQAVTIYFGNGIQNWAVDKARETAGRADHWFMTDEQYERSNGETDFATFPPEHPYWQSSRLQQNLDEIMEQWVFRILSGSEDEGAGPDLTGVIGGFREELPSFLNQQFRMDIPVVAYEGGPSIYTHRFDDADKRNAGITEFIMRMNEHDRIKEVYAIQLNIAVAKGLQMHMPFTLQNRWGKWGQWGHVRRFSDTRANAPKYDAVLSWMESEINYTPTELSFSQVFSRHSLQSTEVGALYNVSYIPENASNIELISTTDLLGLDVFENNIGINFTGVPAKKGKIYSLISYLDSNVRKWVVIQISID